MKTGEIISINLSTMKWTLANVHYFTLNDIGDGIALEVYAVSDETALNDEQVNAYNENFEPENDGQMFGNASDCEPMEETAIILEQDKIEPTKSLAENCEILQICKCGKPLFILMDNGFLYCPICKFVPFDNGLLKKNYGVDDK